MRSTLIFSGLLLVTCLVAMTLMDVWGWDTALFALAMVAVFALRQETSRRLAGQALGKRLRERRSKRA